MAVKNKSLSQQAAALLTRQVLHKNAKCSSECDFAILDAKQRVCCLYKSDVFILVVVITE